MNFMGIGQTVSLSLDIFAEFFCSIFLILGLFTRLACIPIINSYVVVLLKVIMEIYLEMVKTCLYFAATLTLLFCGPGKISVDGMIGK